MSFVSSMSVSCVIFVCLVFFLFFKQKTAYEMRISDWSSDVCSSDLAGARAHRNRRSQPAAQAKRPPFLQAAVPKPPQQQLRHPPPPLDNADPGASHNPSDDATRDV